MPSIGAAEIVIILVLALLVFGPKRLPEMGRSLGRTVREFKKASDTARKEFGVDEIEKELKGVQSELKGVQKSVADVKSDLKIDIDAETAKPTTGDAAASAAAAAASVAGPAVSAPSMPAGPETPAADETLAGGETPAADAAAAEDDAAAAGSQAADGAAAEDETADAGAAADDDADEFLVGEVVDDGARADEHDATPAAGAA